MSDVADRYCSDCAWPYECAAAKSCHRRDMGEVRGVCLTPGLVGRHPFMAILDDHRRTAMRNAALTAWAFDLLGLNAPLRLGYERTADGEASSSKPKRVMVTITNAGDDAWFSRFAEARIRRAISEAVMRSADDLRRRMTRPSMDVPDDWLCDAHADYEQGRPFLLGYVLATSPSDAEAHEQGEGAGASGRAERDPDNRAEQAGGVSE